MSSLEIFPSKQNPIVNFFNSTGHYFAFGAMLFLAHIGENFREGGSTAVRSANQKARASRVNTYLDNLGIRAIGDGSYSFVALKEGDFERLKGLFIKNHPHGSRYSFAPASSDPNCAFFLITPERKLKK